MTCCKWSDNMSACLKSIIFTRKHPGFWSVKGVWCGWKRIVIGKSKMVAGFNENWSLVCRKTWGDTDVFPSWWWYEIIEWNFCKRSYEKNRQTDASAELVCCVNRKKGCGGKNSKKKKHQWKYRKKQHHSGKNQKMFGNSIVWIALHVLKRYWV